ncbi:WD repeat-containing protein 76 isoform X2 [Ascaphus truei]|uniref:WD repeat-containing protein 76 isoform X2 n=1 Tax=Ascaphus truei TaxID=8439 RepID=UPI003F59D1DC
MQKRRQQSYPSEGGAPEKRARVLLDEGGDGLHPVVLLSRMTLEPGTQAEAQSSEEVTDEEYTQERAGLSAYELERLHNIKQNAKFLASLNLLQSAASLRSSTKKRRRTNGSKKEKPKKMAEESLRRRSMRLQRVDPPGTSLPDKQELPEPAPEEIIKPQGPLEMIPANDQEDTEATDVLLRTWESISQENVNGSVTRKTGSIKRYRESLKVMKLQEEAVMKVVKSRIFCVAVHPSQSRSLVAAGDKWGHVGLWDLDHSSSYDGVCMFAPHARSVSCMSFSPSNSAHLLSLSYDGTMRCGDVSRAVFDEVREDFCAAMGTGYVFCISCVPHIRAGQ